jgi:redox-sensitive bicupin YhaK (pirin superfamily)
MPTIFEPDDLSSIQKNGTRIATLANPAMLGTDALQVERIELQAATKTSLYGAADAERFIYVIRGKGQAHVGNQMFPLAEESLLWLEKEDSFSLEAGADGLEVLLCQAPAGE